MEQITCELNGIKYLMVEMQYTDKNRKWLDVIIKKHNCIYQGIKEFHKNTLFSNGFAIIKILVPEENVIAFNNEENPEL